MLDLLTFAISLEVVSLMGAGGKLERILHVLAEELQARGKLQLEGGFHRRLLARGQKRGLAVGRTCALPIRSFSSCKNAS